MKRTTRLTLLCLLTAGLLALTGWSAPVQDPAAATNPTTAPATAPATDPAAPAPAETPPMTPPVTPPVTPPAVDAPAGPAPAQAAPAPPEYQTTASGLRYKITAPAVEPATAQIGDWVSVHYTGKLENGQVFDTNIRLVPEGRFMMMKPFTFKLGEKRVIAGWEEGVLGMKVGEKRTLVIPPELAYGKTGAGRGLIPPDATLNFDVQLIGLYRPEPEAPATPGQ